MKAYLENELDQATVSRFCFVAYIYFVFDFFIHLASRVPAYGIVRPTILLVLVITLSLLSQKDKLSGFDGGKAFATMKWLIIYLFSTLILVEWPGSVVANLPNFLKVVVFLFFTALIIDTEKRLKIFLVTFVGCQVFRVLEPLYLNITSGYWGSSTFLDGGFENRLSGAPSDVVNPNGLGFTIVTAVPFLHYFLWTGKLKEKVLYLVLLGLLVYTLTLTMSRGAMVALLVVAWMIFKDSKNKATLVMAFILGFMLMWAGLDDVRKDRYMSLVSSDSKSSKTTSGRLDGMMHEFSLGLERPIVGHGLGTTPEAKVHAGGRNQAAHNFYAELLIETGFIGLFIFVSYILAIYKVFKSNNTIIENMKKGANAEDYIFYERLNLALTAVFWMYVVYSINYYGLSVYYWYLFGGLTIAFGRVFSRKVEFDQCKTQQITP